MLSELPDGWRLSPLGQVARIETGKTPSTKQDEFWGGNIPFVTPSDLDGSLFVKNTDRSLTAAGAEKSKLIPAGSLVFTCIASIGKAAINEIDCVTNQQINACTFDSPEETLFYHYQLQHRLNDLMALAGQTAVAIINKGKFSAFSVVVPPLNEQHRIAEILSSVDASIQATQVVIEQAERVKRGLMEELLTGGLGSEAIERGEVPEDWRTTPFAEFCEIKAGFGFPVKLQGRTEGDFPFYKVGDMNSSGNEQFMSVANHYVTKADLPVLKAKPYPAGAVIFPKIGAAIKTNKKRRLTRESLIDNNVMALVAKENVVTPDYLFRIMERTDIYQFSSQNGLPSINKSTIAKAEALIPPLNEQHRIAEILSSVDELVAKQKLVFEQQVRTKRGLMDDLLTGKVRTV